MAWAEAPRWAKVVRDSGAKDVAVALRKDSQGVKKAQGEKLEVMEVAAAASHPWYSPQSPARPPNGTHTFPPASVIP